MKELSERSKQYQRMLDSIYDIDRFGDPIAEEDLSIMHENGTRSCLNWELAGKGFHIVELEEF